MNSIQNTPEVEEIRKSFMTENYSLDMSALISVLFDFYLRGIEDEKNQEEIPSSFVHFLQEKKAIVLKTYMEIQIKVIKEIQEEFLKS